jgi:hypothetical protein
MPARKMGDTARMACIVGLMNFLVDGSRWIRCHEKTIEASSPDKTCLAVRRRLV